MSKAEKFRSISISSAPPILSLDGQPSAFASNGGIKTAEAGRQGIPLLQLSPEQKERLEQAEAKCDRHMGTGVVVRDMPGYPVSMAVAKGAALVGVLGEMDYAKPAFVSDTGWWIQTGNEEMFLNKPQGSAGIQAVSRVWLAARDHQWAVGNVAVVVNVNAERLAQLVVVTADLGRMLPSVDSTNITGAVANDPHISGGIRTVRHGHIFHATDGQLNIMTFRYPVMTIDGVSQMLFPQSFIGGDGEAFMDGRRVLPTRQRYDLAWDSANNGGIMAAMFGLLR